MRNRKLSWIQYDDLKLAIPKQYDLKVKVQDPLLEVNMGDDNEPKSTFVSQLLELEFQAKLIELLR